MVFLYGGMVWGILPFLPIPDISWESHLSGGIIGLVLSMFFRHQGPQRKIYEWESDEEEWVEPPMDNNDGSNNENTSESDLTPPRPIL